MSWFPDIRFHFTAHTLPKLVTIKTEQKEEGDKRGNSPFQAMLSIFIELAFDLNKNLLHRFLIASIVICINIEVNRTST